MIWNKGMYIFCLFLFFTFSQKGFGQDLIINEVMTSNSTTIYDEDGDTPDWIEIYNKGSIDINLEGYGLSDSFNVDLFWKFPAAIISPGEHLLIFASDKNRSEIPLHWETVIDVGDTFRYIVPTVEPPADWRTSSFDDSLWEEGKSGFGYGDGDDSTVVENVLSIFFRTTFNVDDPSTVQEAMLHMDYDDAFVAFINGTEIARGNISSAGFPSFDLPADNGDHEARMYNGGQPEAFFINNISGLLVPGENIFSVQAHNSSTGSSDMSSIPFLTLGHNTSVPGGLSDYLQLTPKSLHTNFKLSSDGETVYLSNAAEEVIDTLYTGQLIANLSIGSNPDGADNISYFNEATPGQPNSTEAFESFANNVEFSVSGGMYSDLFYVKLFTANPEDSIYYTTNGAEPNSSHSLFKDSILVVSTKVIRARVVKSNSVPGIINSATYLFNTNHNIPVISITTDPVNLWDYNEGIYVNGPNASSEYPYFGANFWNDWERPIHVEMYEPDGTQAFSQNAGVKIFGGWSRGNAQKSLTIHSRKSYGDGPIKYKMFAEKDLEEFSSLVLRNSGNDWNNTMLRDGVLTSLFHEVVDRQAFRAAVLYINGEYWGIQNIREKVNEHFVADNHDLNSDDISILEGNGSTVVGDSEHYQNMIAFVNNNSLANQQNYEYIQTQMDVFDFMQYYIGNIYIDNTDWPGNNIKFWRENTEGGKWRWISYDTDFGFGIWNYNQVTNNTLAFALNPSGPNWPNPPWSTLLFRKLMENQEFRNLFINAYADRLNTDYLPANVKSKINNATTRINSEITRHLSRWGGDINYWNQKISEMRQFADNRPNNARDHIRSQFSLPRNQSFRVEINDESLGRIHLNTIDLENYPWSGVYFEGVPVKLTAIPKPGYRFVRWEGDVTSTNASIEVNLTKSTFIRAFFAYDDNELTSIIINEINYNSSNDFDTGDWVELFNRGSQSVDISGWVLKDDDDAHGFVFPENTVIPSNGFLIVCRNQADFSALRPEVTDIIGDMDFGLSGSGDCVRLFNTDEIMVDDVCYGVTNPWPELPNGDGATLALTNPFADGNDPDNWYALTSNGNPGEENRLVSGLNDEVSLNRLLSYPNPFSGDMNLQYSIEQPGQVTINIFDQQGRLVEHLINSYHSSGNFEFQWTAQNAATGLFIVRMESADGVFLRKVIKN